MKKHSGPAKGSSKAGSIARPHIGGMETAGRMLPMSGGVIEKSAKQGAKVKHGSGQGSGVGFAHHKATPEGVGHGTRHDKKHQNVGFGKKTKKG